MLDRVSETFAAASNWLNAVILVMVVPDGILSGFCVLQLQTFFTDGNLVYLGEE